MEVQQVLKRLSNVGKSRDGWKALCPAHDDSNPSLAVAEGRDGTVLLYCHAGCSFEEIRTALGLDPADLTTRSGSGPGYTLTDYADEKGLPAAELRRWGVKTRERRDKPPVVAIPYHDQDGETDGVKIRNGEKFWWDEHSKLPYGLDRLTDADDEAPVLLVEGESDCHAAWLEDVLTVGVPGAEAWRSEWTDYFDGHEVFVWQEPDKAGEDFVESVTADLPEAKVIEAPEDAKDPAELRQLDSDGFRERFNGLMEQATEFQTTADENGNSVSSVSTEWGPLLELGPGEPPPYPVEVLPGWVRRHVESVTEACQVPSDLPFLLALTSLSVAVANKARVRVRPGYTEPAHLWEAVVLPPASRKSPVFKHMTEPIMAWEAEQAEEVRPKRRRKLDEKGVAEKALKTAKTKAAKAGSDEDFGEHRQNLHEARKRLENIEVPTPPRLVASDVTSEKLAELMAENHGRIAVLAPEGDIFRIMSGRYSGGVNFDHYKRGWTGGETIRDDRMSRDGSHVSRPALTLGLTVQPSVLDTLTNKQSFRGEGLLGRFVYAMPDSGIGSRKTGRDVTPLDTDAAAAYKRNLQRLLESEPADVDSDEMYVPHELSLSEEAWEAWCEFDAEVEEMLGPGGRLEHLRDWGGKLMGHVTRIALMLHVAQHAGTGPPPWSAPVSGEAMRGAIRVGRVAIGHALRVFDRLEMDPETQLARYVVKRLRNLDEDEPTVRDLHRACQDKKGLGTMDKLKEVLSTLKSHNYVRTKEQSSGGPGRNPSPWVLLHPDATSDPDRNDRKGSGPTKGEDSVSTVRDDRGEGEDEEGPSIETVSEEDPASVQLVNPQEAGPYGSEASQENGAQAKLTDLTGNEGGPDQKSGSTSEEVVTQ